MAAEVERTLLNHYKLSSLYPSEWPDRDDESDASDDETAKQRRDPNASPTFTSRFPGLDRHASLRSSISGTQKASGGADSLVQKDEPDPLGIAPSVVHELRRKGLPVEDNLRLRNRFMLSSTTFSPTLFLSQVHQTASTDSLLHGLDFLSASIEKKSASLKLLVESNFERFVRAKATIDNVYTEMRTQGAEPSPLSPVPGRRPHSRHASRGSTHFRNTSGAFSPMGTNAAQGKKKNALTKESEYGVLGIKAPLIELASKAEEVWGPALGGRDKEEELKATLAYVEKHRSIFTVAGTLQEAVKTHDYDTLIEEYKRAKKLADEARAIADAAMQYNTPLTDVQVRQILVAAKVWSDAQLQISTFKRDAWKQLSNPQLSRDPRNGSHRRDAHMDLIATLLQLGVEESPIWFWLSARFNNLKDKLIDSFDRMRIEVEVSRRQLSNVDPPSLQVSRSHLQSAAAGFSQDRKTNMDTAKILDFWEKVQTGLGSLLTLQGGVLGDIVDFWEAAQSFMSGKAQRNLPSAVFSSGAMRQHLELSDDQVARLHTQAAELVSITRDNIFAFFADPPIENISAMCSPILPTPITPSPMLTPSLTPNGQRKFSFDIANIPEASPKRGDSWEKYAFWPPFANSLSGAYYLSRILLLVGTAASGVAGLSLVRDNPRLLEQLKALMNGVRERCAQAVCAAWNSDAERCKLLEDWSRNPERKDLTNMPFHFIAFEETVLAHVQKIMYISEATNRPGSADVLLPPSAKLLQMVRQQFVTSMYKALSGTVENAERVKRFSDSPFDDPDGLVTPARGRFELDPNASTIDASDRNVRMLLTLSNLNHLRRETIPQLIAQFESSFSVKLTEESKTIRDVVGQIDARLFQSYVRPVSDRLSAMIVTGVSLPSWTPLLPRPKNAKPYVYELLLALVLVHTEVSTTATTLTNQILSYLLEQISLTLLQAFKQRPSYTLPALMQATLDVELIAQTLSNYTTEKASETQSQIYLVLDERTDHDARMRLQGELPEMRSILKKLRESTKGQFGCFKRERKSRGDRPSSKPASQG
ncbi:hypothetical protein MBLNU459_g0869t1 [Dothideomycetes sp. NU459]